VASAQAMHSFHSEMALTPLWQRELERLYSQEEAFVTMK